jgi:cytochrome c oxidase cbb3-type subunit III
VSDPLRHDEIQGQIIHVYDGIEEADNDLPRWWLVTFFGSIVFGVFYWMFLVSFPVIDTPDEAYTKARLAALEKGGDVTDEDILLLVDDQPMVLAGKAEFVKLCAKCHGNKGEGKDGPNLTDEFWLYGGAPIDIFNTISNGTSKGMPDWGPKLGRGAVKQITAYVVSLRNTNQPGKAAQGVKWVASPDSQAAPEAEPKADVVAEPSEKE